MRSDVWIGQDELAEVEPLLPGPHGVALNQSVRLVARETVRHECEQHALAEDEAVRRLDVRPHSLRVDHEPLDEPGEAVEDVVERQEGVRDDDALGARVRDVALVPERDVFEADRGRGAHDTREPADPFCYDRVPLVRHGRRAFLALGEGLLHLADLGAGEVSDLCGEALEGRRAERER